MQNLPQEEQKQFTRAQQLIEEADRSCPKLINIDVIGRPHKVIVSQTPVRLLHACMDKLNSKKKTTFTGKGDRKVVLQVLQDFEESIAVQFDEKRAQHLKYNTKDLEKAMLDYKMARKGRHQNSLDRHTLPVQEATLHDLEDPFTPSVDADFQVQASQHLQRSSSVRILSPRVARRTDLMRVAVEVMQPRQTVGPPMVQQQSSHFESDHYQGSYSRGTATRDRPGRLPSPFSSAARTVERSSSSCSATENGERAAVEDRQLNSPIEQLQSFFRPASSHLTSHSNEEPEPDLGA